jgi:hypothetical protein
MTLPSKVNQEVNEVAAEVDRLLKAVDSTPFTAPAFSVFKGKVTQYLSDLVRESDIVAKRDQTDAISVKHVEAACEHLTLKSRNKVYRFAGTIGGIGLGTGVSVLVTMALGGQFSLAGILICTISGMVGSFLLAISIMKD